jgi:hypothetical protein
VSEPTLKDARDVITELLEWEAGTGGWGAPCWRKARELRDRLDDVPRQKYLVRRTIDESVYVDACSEEGALAIAAELPDAEWEESDRCLEAEKWR